MLSAFLLLALPFLPSAAGSAPALPNASALLPIIQNSTSAQLQTAISSLTAFGIGQNGSSLVSEQMIGIIALLGVPQAKLANASAAMQAPPIASSNASGQAAIPQIPSVQGIQPQFARIVSELRAILAIFAFLCYVFAAGKIAEFLKLSGKRITRREALAAPLAYLAAAAAAIAAYYSSGLWVPPQNTIITMAVYLLLVPLFLAIAAGAVALFAFFRDRLGIVRSLDMSMRIVLAPVFDGISGYWTAIGAAAVLALISSFSFYSSGGNLSLVTMDFMLLSAVVALYFTYRAITSQGSEAKASNLVTALCIVAPSILQFFFKDIFCAALRLIPFDLFRTCPLVQLESGATLGVSIAATMLLLVPVVPFIYAGVVNLLRASVLLSAVAQKEAPERGEETEGRG